MKPVIRLASALSVAVALSCVPAIAADGAAAAVASARGDLATVEGRHADAVAAYREALAARPGSLALRLALGQALQSLGRHAEAAAELEVCAALHPRSDDARIALARALGSQGDTRRPVTLLESVAARSPGRPDLGLELASAYLKAGRPADALAALDAGVVSGPSTDGQARLLRGVALARLGRRQQALDALGELAGSVAEPDVARVAGRFRDQIRAGSLGTPGKRWTGWLKSGLQFDDNPVIAPTTNVFGLRAFRVESLGATLSGGVTRVLDSSPRRRVLSSYAFLQTANFEVNEVNLQDHLVDVDAAWSLDGRGTLGVRAAYDNLLVDEASFLQRFSLTPSWSFPGRAGATTQLALRYERKDFLNNAAVTRTVEDRDADNVAAIVARAFPTQARRGVAQLGVIVDTEDARGANLDYHGRLLFCAFTGPVPRTRLTYSTRAQVHLRDYDSLHSLFLVAREDKELSTFAALTYPLASNRWLSLEQTRTKNESNLALFDFERTVHAVTMRWAF